VSYGAGSAPLCPDLGIESDDVVRYCFPSTWPTDREQRANIIGEWLKTEARCLSA
jgi:hypothetical protein